MPFTKKIVDTQTVTPLVTPTDETEKKVTPPVTDGQLDSIAKGMKAQFAKMPKVKVRIPIDKLNPKDLIVTTCTNGYIHQIERGKTVEVPEEIAKRLEESGYLG